VVYQITKEVLLTPEFAKWAADNVILVELDYPRTPQTLKQNRMMDCSKLSNTRISNDLFCQRY
jgi:endonuclease/exonuclease/phosphatase (EEP) superfamily protein YafD